MAKILVIAPHPDDETFGCGGTLCRHAAMGDELHWLLVTSMKAGNPVPPEEDRTRDAEIEAATEAYGFKTVTRLHHRTAHLDDTPLSDIIDGIAAVVRETEPESVYLPFPGDSHSDHRIVFDAGAACTKVFRFPSVRRVLAMETISETGFGIDPTHMSFQPNLYVDITEHLERKIEIMNIYSAETAAFPFPRSETAVRSLAALRGTQAGVEAAEAFMILKEIW